MKIILDTNFLMIPEQFKVDIFSEIRRICDFDYELCVLEATIRELEDIKGKLALELVKAKNIRVIEGEGYADDLLVEEARKGSIIATQDIGLKRRLKEIKAKIIVLRQKSHLALTD